MCLYCGLEAVLSEVFKGIQLYECKEKHRTGIIKEKIVEFEEISIKQKDCKLPKFMVY